MLRIYGIDPSTPTNAVRFTANALHLDYEYVRVNVAAGEGQRTEYLSIHPAGKVPAMDDDGFRLFESGAIQRYLADKHSSSLYPRGLKERALVDQWHLFTALHVASGMGKVFFNRVLYAVVGMERSEADLNEGVKFLARFLPIVDAQLGKSRHLAASDLTIADLLLLAWLDPAEISDVDLDPYGHIIKWRSRLKQQAFYTACHTDYAEMLRALASRQPARSAAAKKPAA